MFAFFFLYYGHLHILLPTSNLVFLRVANVLRTNFIKPQFFQKHFQNAKTASIKEKWSQFIKLLCNYTYPMFWATITKKLWNDFEIVIKQFYFVFFTASLNLFLMSLLLRHSCSFENRTCSYTNLFLKPGVESLRENNKDKTRN